MALSLLDGLELVFLDKLGILTVENLPFFTFLKVFKGMGFLSSLALHEEHPSLLCLLELFSEFFLLFFLFLLLLLLLFLVLKQGLFLGIFEPLLFHLNFHFFFLTFLLLLLSERLSCGHNGVLFLVDCRLEFVLFLVVLLPLAFLLFLSLPFYITESFSELFKGQLLKQTNAHILDLLLWPGPDFFF